MSRILTTLTAAFLALTPAFAAEPGRPLLPPDRPIEQVVDHYIDAELASAKVQAAPQADDAAVLRRLTLDLTGRIPTPAELADYLASKDSNKKTQAVERLMAAPGFVRHQATEFTTFLRSDGSERRKGQGKAGLQEYLQTAFAENRAWDRIFRELLLPDETNPKTKGSSEFLRSRVKDMNRLTIDASSDFFGVNIGCAQCHDHPHVQDWKQEHFYGMKSFFARTYENKDTLAERDTGVVKYIPNKGTEKVAKVMFLTGKVVETPGQEGPAKKGGKNAAPKVSLRSRLVELALEPEQRDFFSRAVVNRLWHRLLGRGLVTPLDQMHSANPPSHPELLAWLARDLVSHGYDLRRLTRGLVLSQAYARSSRRATEDAPAEKYFAVGQVRALTPMQMAVSLRLATRAPDKLPSGAALEPYLTTLEKDAARLAVLFAQPGDNFQVGASEAMLFANNEALLEELLKDAPGFLVNRLKQEPDLSKRVDLAVRSVLSRPASAEEMQALSDYMRRREDRPAAACQQVVWALLTSPEFRFNH